MTIMAVGIGMLVIEFAVVALAICSGNIPFLCRLLGGEPEREETGHGIRPRDIGHPASMD